MLFLERKLVLVSLVVSVVVTTWAYIGKRKLFVFHGPDCSIFTYA